MRIAMLLRNAFVRDARVLREAQALTRAGHDVEVIATMEPDLPRRESRDGFRIHRIDALPPSLTRLAGRPLIASQSVPAKPSARPPALIALRDRIVSRRFARAASKVAADAFHAHDLNTLAAGVAAARTRGVPLVYDAHELYSELAGFSPAERRRWTAVEKALIGRASRVITVSDGIADELARRYGIERPLVLLNCPERPSRPIVPTESPLYKLRGPGEMLVLYAGAMEPNRGLEQLADASRNARGWRLVMMGWGKLEDELRRRSDRITFVEPVPPGEIVAAAAGADVGVIPYVPAGLNNTLSLPNKLFDYLHAGLAVAASDLPQIRRIVEAERAGVVFEPGNAGAIAQALDELAADRHGLARMKEASQEATARYEWGIEKQKLLDVYAPPKTS
ncbi:MAG: glycosyltransferase family 4 protein [Actinomycetota bacterium]|nr:glycosyltransferase family 4 protein [Actinomycetota bacterium]